MGLFPKLFELQKRLKPIKKESNNPFFKSKYADINAIIEATKDDIQMVGLVILQPLSMKDGKPGIKTIVVDHDTGEMVDEFFPIPELVDAQKMGSAITYYRRFALQSLLVLQTEDDDANTASDKQTPPSAPYEPTEHTYVEPEITAEELNEIDKAFGIQGVQVKNEVPFKTTKVVGQTCPDCKKGTIIPNRTAGKGPYCDQRCWIKK